MNKPGRTVGTTDHNRYKRKIAVGRGASATQQSVTVYIFHSRRQSQDDMRDKFFTYTDRVSIYAKGKFAFEEGRLRSSNPYAASQEFGGLWWYGWDMAEKKSQGEASPMDQLAL